ncbi:hypothetical protein [Mycobacterium sp.]|uniref:hypothetical protein n=1 Tax=Mycobacterium sp. TaxID=1785 RepID=UPI003BAD4765
MAGRAAFAVAVAALVAGTLSACLGTGGKPAVPSRPLRSSEGSRLPPIYPGTTVSIPPSSEPAEPVSTIAGDGTYQVGTEIQPGTYRSEAGRSCRWWRLSGLDGGSSDIISNGSGPGLQVVQIAPTDVAFATDSCPPWTLESAAITATSTTTMTITTTPDTAATTAALPPDAQLCPGETGPVGGFTQSAAGTSGTSCAFAEQVRIAYGASGPPSPTPRQVQAVSPVTGQSYTMACAADGRLVTCTGGDGAVVYLY